MAKGSWTLIASILPALNVASICGNGTSTNLTLLELPPFLSIHAIAIKWTILFNVLTATVLPSRSFAVFSGEFFATWIAWLSFLAFTLVAPPAMSLKSNPSTRA